jgi:hypothetical protein
LGTSLADVAAFMHEIELQQGFFTPKVDGRGIERLRFLAMQLEGMGKTNTADADVSYLLSFTNARSAYHANNKRAALPTTCNMAQTQRLNEVAGNSQMY